MIFKRVNVIIVNNMLFAADGTERIWIVAAHARTISGNAIVLIVDLEDVPYKYMNNSSQLALDIHECTSHRNLKYSLIVE